jgi:hypothetical protein
MTVKVKEFRKFEKPIHAQARLDRVVYTHGDVAKMVVDTTTLGMVTVFSYDPVSDTATKIFPLPGVRGQLWTYKMQPMQVNIPANLFPVRDQPYNLLVLVSGGPLDTLNNYRLHEFHEMHDNIPYQDVTYIRKSFYVSRSKM